MSSPDYGLGDDFPPPPSRTKSPGRSDTALPLHSTTMGTGAASTLRESIFIPDDEVQELVPIRRQSNKVQTIQESSEDDEPIAATRRRRDARPLTRSTAKPSPPKPVKKFAKKPSPSRHDSKPIMKNDMKVKKALVKEIESYWGKNFIKSYIPKCHRPLVKRGIHGKRSTNRGHETNPRNWLPSVLKAILMIAKLTNNKTWLNSAMAEVVRYRIKNTGNRKPQLVTTDFDVIEDMLVKDWKVEFSFGIRYKHLLVNRKDQVEDDEDVERIMRASESEGSCEDQDDSGASESSSDDDVEQQQQQVGDVSKGQHYHQPPSSSPRGKKSKTPKKQSVKDESPMRPQPPPPGIYDGYYGQPPTDQWCRPMMMPPQGGGFGGYGGYRGFSGYPSFGQPPFPNHGRRPSYQPPHQSRQQRMYDPRQPLAMTSSPNTPGSEGHDREFPKIKRESPSVEEEQAEDFGNPGFFGHQQVMADDAVVAEEEEEDIDAAVAAAEAELKLARLRAKRARMARK